jgi:hypothetical protein
MGKYLEILEINLSLFNTLLNDNICCCFVVLGNEPSTTHKLLELCPQANVFKNVF